MLLRRFLIFILGGCNDGGDDANATPPKCGGKGEPKCVTPPVLCEDPGTPMHSVRLGQTYTEGSKLQFLCQPPYRLVGDEFRTCSSEKRKSNTPTGDGNGGWRRAGDWSGTQPTCVPPTCPKVDTINDGIVIGTFNVQKFSKIENVVDCVTIY